MLAASKLIQLGKVLTGMLTTQAHASETAMEASPLAAAPINAVTQDDLVILFGAEQAAEPMQLAALSDAEMRETEGAWAIYLARMGYGGLASGIRYAVSNWGTPQYSAWGNLRAVGYGAVGGLFGWNSWSAATLGAAVGAAGQRWGW